MPPLVPSPRDRYDLTENDLFAIWASDGVWEFLQNEDVAKILATHTPNWDAAIGAVIEVWGRIADGSDREEQTAAPAVAKYFSGRVV